MFTGLTSEVTDAYEFILRGSATAMVAGDILYVQTALTREYQSMVSTGIFSTTYLPNYESIPVEQGQSIAVSVTFTFSN